MKILYLSLFYPPHHIGGTENYTHGFAKGLQALGHETQVLCVEEWGEGDTYWNPPTDDVFDGVSVHKLNLNWTRAPHVNRFLYDNSIVADYVRDYLRQVKPDVVHVTSCNTLSASVIQVAKQAGVPVIVTLTDFWFLCPRVNLVKRDGTMCNGHVPEAECFNCLVGDSKIYRASERVLGKNATNNLLGALGEQAILARLPGLRGTALNMRERRAKMHKALQYADRLIIASQSGYDLFRLNDFAMPIDVVHYGHDLAWMRDYHGKTQRDAIHFGFIGQVSPLKGPHLLIQAFKDANPNGKARLLVYGNLDKDPAFGQQLRALADQRTDIEFRGIYAHADSGKVFADIDVLVVPSIWNDYPLIINEAFATQTPVMASDIAGMSEFVRPEVCGLLFERGYIADLAKQLGRVMNEPGLLARLRANAPHVKTIQEAIAEMLQVYQSVARSSK